MNAATGAAIHKGPPSLAIKTSNDAVTTTPIKIIMNALPGSANNLPRKNRTMEF
ncbi:hypothetical protein [Bradyrhizobium sp. JR3.5]